MEHFCQETRQIEWSSLKLLKTCGNQARSDGIRQSDPDDCTLSLYNQSNQELALTALAYWSF